MKYIEYRQSEFVDFDTCVVKIAPMDLQRTIASPGQFDLPAKIRFFHCCVDVWQLAVAVQLSKEIESHDHPSVWSHSAYGLLSVVFTYFERIGKILNPKSAGHKTARIDFNYGFCDVYPEFRVASGQSDDESVPEVVRFRDGVRNGLYHLALTKYKVMIHNNLALSQNDVEISTNISEDKSEWCLVNPHTLTRTIVNHLPSLIARLNSHDPNYDSMRDKMKEYFDSYLSRNTQSKRP